MKIYVYSTFWSCSEGDNFSKIVVIEEDKKGADRIAHEFAEKEALQITGEEEYEIKKGLVI